MSPTFSIRRKSLPRRSGSTRARRARRSYRVTSVWYQGLQQGFFEFKFSASDRKHAQAKMRARLIRMFGPPDAGSDPATARSFITFRGDTLRVEVPTLRLAVAA